MTRKSSSDLYVRRGAIAIAPDNPVKPYNTVGRINNTDFSARKDTIRDTTSGNKRGVAYKVVSA